MSRDIGTLIVNTAVLGSLYALTGVGFVVLYRCTGVINFAQGAFMALAAFLFYTMAVDRDFGIPVSVALALLGGGIVAAAIYTIAFRRLIGAPPFSLIIASFGLSIVISTVIAIVWGPVPKRAPTVLGQRLFSIFGVNVVGLDVFTVGFSAVLFAALVVVLQKTRFGARMRAVAGDPLLAGLARINVHAMSAMAWAISGLCAGAAGICFALQSSTVDSIALQSLGLVAFAAVLLGGLDSVVGAAVGGLLLAGAQTAATLAFGGAWSDVTAYVILLLLLLLRPGGLFGSRLAVRI